MALFCIGQGSEPIGGKAFIARRAVERFDEVVVGRFAWPAEINLALLMVSPQVQQMGGELAAIVHSEVCGAARHESVQCCDGMLTAQTGAHLYVQGFPCINIEDGEHAKFVAIGQLVHHEIHAPDMIGMGNGWPLSACHGRLASLVAPLPQLQLFQAVPAISRVDAKPSAFALEQDVQATVASACAYLRQHLQALA